MAGVTLEGADPDPVVGVAQDQAVADGKQRYGHVVGVAVTRGVRQEFLGDTVYVPARVPGDQVQTGTLHHDVRAAVAGVPRRQRLKIVHEIEGIVTSH